MTPKTEIYSVKFNKYSTGNGDVAYSLYTVGVVYEVGKVKLSPVKIQLIKDRIHVTFSDGGKHVFGYGNDCELFYRPVELKKEEPKKE
jgi:hypothetical protein